MKKKIIVFKNDRIGDLIWSLDALRFLINFKKDYFITIYLSEINYSMNFLLDKENTNFKKIKYHLSTIEKIKIIYFFIFNKIDEVYIFRPNNFFYILPLLFFFKKTNFFGYCVNNTNQYKRPNNFLRKFLYKKVINDRSSNKIREHTSILQKKLVNFDLNFFFEEKIVTKNFDLLPNDFILFQFKKDVFEKLNIDINNLDELLKTISKFNLPIILIKDKEFDIFNTIFRKKYNYINLKKKIFKKKLSNIYFVDNVTGKNFFDIIYNSKITIAPHGTVTSIANLKSNYIIDLFFLKTDKINFYEAKNSFHEFKPKLKNYNFILVNNNFSRTKHKIQYLLNRYFRNE